MSSQQQGRQTPLSNIRLSALVAERSNLEDLQQTILETEIVDRTETEEFTAELFSKLKSEGELDGLSHFNQEEIQDMYRTIQSFEPEFVRRGPKPKICNLDAFIVLLLFYKLGCDQIRLAQLLGIPDSTLMDCINRVRPLVKKSLASRWWNDRKRPQVLQGEDGNDFPYIGLLVDSTSEEVFRPRARFEEAKRYWDGKNKIYALKKEVAVMAAPPHYALFSAKAEIGSVHDFEIHKSVYPSYLEYLKKTEAEKGRFVSDGNSNWAILGDKAYYTTTASEGTPGERRVAVKRGATALADLRRNEKLSRIRVKVECFFGRMKKLWAITSKVYRLDHTKFDDDFDICLLLTNEHIRNHQLNNEDKEFYDHWLEARKVAAEERKRKEDESREKYRTAKRQARTRTSFIPDSNSQ
jgi:hypothetical protein